jgi:hypothetical protein
LKRRNVERRPTVGLIRRRGCLTASKIIWRRGALAHDRSRSYFSAVRLSTSGTHYHITRLRDFVWTYRGKRSFFSILYPLPARVPAYYPSHKGQNGNSMFKYLWFFSSSSSILSRREREKKNFVWWCMKMSDPSIHPLIVHVYVHPPTGSFTPPSSRRPLYNK